RSKRDWSSDVCSSDLLYGENYGYRSGLNQSMVQHLQKKVEKILAMVQLDKGDLVVDIGSNDSTLLQAYPDSLTLLGVDPSGPKRSEERRVGKECRCRG